jgi:hypothetical protein
MCLSTLNGLGQKPHGTSVKKPRREQLLVWIDNNPNEREAWNEFDRIANKREDKAPSGEHRGSII